MYFAFCFVCYLSLQLSFYFLYRYWAQPSSSPPPLSVSIIFLSLSLSVQGFYWSCWLFDDNLQWKSEQKLGLDINGRWCWCRHTLHWIDHAPHLIHISCFFPIICSVNGQLNTTVFQFSLKYFGFFLSVFFFSFQCSILLLLLLFPLECVCLFWECYSICLL